MPLTQDHHMVQAFTSNRTDQPFHKRILPRTLGRGDDLFHTQRLDAATKLVAVDRITITDQIMLAITFRKGSDNLLCRPFSGWMFGDAEVNNSSP